MQFQVATLCDAAHEKDGKLYVWGTFDTICAEPPTAGSRIVHPQCAFAMRICFQPGDEGDHELVIRLIDDDGKPRFELPPARIRVELPAETYSLTRNQVIGIRGLPFERFGQYSLDIIVDGEMHTRIPLRVMKVQKKQGRKPDQGETED